MRDNLGAYISYGIVFAVSFVIVFFIGGIVPYTVFYLVLAIPVFALLQLRLMVSFLKYTLKCEPPQIVKGADAELVLEAVNRMFIMPMTYVELTIMDSPGLSQDTARTHIISLLPRERKEVRLPVRFRYRGIYQTGLESIRLGDMFNLFRINVRVGERLRTVVYPERIYLSRLGLPSVSNETTGRRRIHGAQELSDVSDTRRYEYGDALSRIHWNITAQKQQMTTKLYDHEQDERVLVLFDSRRASDDPGFYLAVEDCAVSACLAVVYFLLGRGKSVTVRFLGGEKITEIDIGNGGRADAVYEALSDVDFDAENSPYMLMTDTKGSVHLVFVFSAVMTAEDTAAFTRIMDKDCTMYAYRVVPDTDTVEVGKGNQCILRPSDDLKRMLEVSGCGEIN